MKQGFEASNRRIGPAPKGFALVTVLLLVSLLAVISIALHRTGTIHATLTYHQEDGETAYYTAMAGVQHALFVLIDNPSFRGPLDTSGPNEIPFEEGSYAATVINGEDVPVLGSLGEPPMGEVLISSTGKVGSTKRTIEKWACPADSAPQQIVLRDDNDDKDTYLREEEPVLRYGGSPELRIGSCDSNGLRAAFEFDLNQIPAGVNILSATLEIYMYGNVTGSPGVSHLEIEAHRITRSWVEGNEIDVENGSGACWDWYQNENDWTTPGAEFDSTVLSTTNILYGDINRWYGWDVTTLVEGWVDGIFPNDGVILKDVDEGFPSQNDSMEALFYSRESSNPNYRPKLTVVYQIPDNN